MAPDIYQKLARHLDNLPGGFPSSETGVQYRILNRLFTTDEAEFALHLSLIPEAAKVIARRAGKKSADISAIMIVIPLPLAGTCGIGHHK